MSRGRLAAWIEVAREGVEGDLASLGTARVLLELVQARVESAWLTGQTSALGPAEEDLDKIERLINRVQARMQKRFEKELRNENDRVQAGS
jgi:hypothetical protein